MKKHTTKLTSKSIEGSGLPSDYKKAIAEYIWNGFDAGASKEIAAFAGGYIGADSLPEQSDGDAIAIIGMHASTTQLEFIAG